MSVYKRLAQKTVKQNCVGLVRPKKTAEGGRLQKSG